MGQPEGNQQKGNKPDVAGIFWSCFLLDTACILNEDLLSNAGMCFDGVVVAIDTVLQSLKGKYYWELMKLGCRNFLGMSQNVATRILR